MNGAYPTLPSSPRARTKQRPPRHSPARTNGVAVTPPAHVDWRAHRDAPSHLRFVRAGDWPSGLYFLRATSTDGRSVRAVHRPPARLGEHRASPSSSRPTPGRRTTSATRTETAGATPGTSRRDHSVDLERPFLDFGVPFRFRDWDLNFISWLNRPGSRSSSCPTTTSSASGRGRARARVRPRRLPRPRGVRDEHALRRRQRYRDLGGNLLFLSANNFFWRVRRRDAARARGSSGARSAGPRRRSSACSTSARTTGASGPFIVTRRRRGAVGIRRDGARERRDVRPLRDRDRRAHGRLAARHHVLARDPGPDRPGRSAEMTYYETPAGREGLRGGRAQLRRLDRRPPGLAGSSTTSGGG